MKRQQVWIPDTHPDTRFVTEWDDEDIEAPHRCISATIGGIEAKGPQGVYERVLAENQAKNRRPN